MNGMLQEWNASAEHEARERLLACCGCTAWAEELVALRPFVSLDSLLAAAHARWLAGSEEEWLAAFACHPRIGERGPVQLAGKQFAEWSEGEQSLAQFTVEDVGERMRLANDLYELRFGFLYIVSAQGRTAAELLEVLEARLENDRAAELAEAARQQDAITELRMRKWLRP